MGSVAWGDQRYTSGVPATFGVAEYLSSAPCDSHQLPQRNVVGSSAVPQLPPWSEGWRRYALMLGAVALSALVRFLVGPMVGTRVPFLTFFLAVFTTAWFAGLRPTIGATLLSLLSGILFFDSPSA